MRAGELQAGYEVYVECAEIYHSLDFKQMLDIASQVHPKPPVVTLFLYLIATHFNDNAWTEFEEELQQSPSLKGFHQYILPMTTNLIQSIQKFIKQKKLPNDLFSRYLMLEELKYLSDLRKFWATRIEGSSHRKDQIELQMTNYVHLLYAGYGNPFLIEIFGQYGWLQQWQVGFKEKRYQFRSFSKHSLKGQISKYIPKELGKQLIEAFDEHEPLSVEFKTILNNHLKESLLPLRPTLHGKYCKHLREIIQATMNITVSKLTVVDKVAHVLVESCMTYSQTKTIYQQEFCLYMIVQELILGAQNLKYRLNDCTRGIATALAYLLEKAPKQIQKKLFAVALHAILDSIMELYESFSLADNTLRSFGDTYQQSNQEIAHNHWLKTESCLSPLLEIEQT